MHSWVLAAPSVPGKGCFLVPLTVPVQVAAVAPEVLSSQVHRVVCRYLQLSGNTDLWNGWLMLRGFLSACDGVWQKPRLWAFLLLFLLELSNK